MKMRHILWLLIWCSSVASAETVYVDDTLHVGVRAEPVSTGAALAVVTTGDALEVLQRRKGFIQVKLTDGRTGWMKAQYVSAQMPARLLLARAQQSAQLTNDELTLLRSREADSQRQLGELHQQVARLVAENARQGTRIETLEKENTGLGMRLERKPQVLRVAAPPASPLDYWRSLGLGALLVLLLGMLAGSAWQRGRLRQRMGGFHY